MRGCHDGDSVKQDAPLTIGQKASQYALVQIARTNVYIHIYMSIYIHVVLYVYVRLGGLMWFPRFPHKGRTESCDLLFFIQAFLEFFWKPRLGKGQVCQTLRILSAM